MLIRKTESEHLFTLAFGLQQVIAINKSMGLRLRFLTATDLLRRAGLSHTGQRRPDILSTTHQVSQKSQETTQNVKKK